jgi:hypothetical protein
MPADTYGYVQVDIDPSAGQKLAAVRFLSKVPEVKDLADGDARKKLWGLAVAEADNECISKFDYDRDIAPWLGDRVGFGVRPGGTSDEPNVIDSALAAVAQGRLSDKATFKEDLAALGEQGVASTWWDLGPATKELTNVAAGTLLGTSGAAPAAVEGRLVATLRFDPGFAEIAGMARGLTGAQAVKPVDGDSRELANLPDDTAAAVHLGGAGQLVDQIWPELKKQLDDATSGAGIDDPVGTLEDQLGLALPDDLKTLLGSSFTVSLPDQAFGSDVPVMGAKVVTSNAQRAQEVIEKIEEAAGSAGILTKKVTGDRLVVATTPDYASRLETGGKLGDTDAFKAAIGDPTKVDYALFVDLDRLEKLYVGELDGASRAVAEAVRSLGIASTVTGAGEASFSVRVVAN